MNKTEILQCVAGCHNRLAQITVSGDGAILMGDTLRDLRVLVQVLQKDIEAEETAEVEEHEDS